MEKKTIYFCGGCFWGTQRAFQQLSGVIDSEVGYANGKSMHPTYREVCQGNTGHKECVKVVYQPELISLNTLLKAYFLSIHPEQADGQGNDIGSQYLASVIVLSEEDEKEVAAYFEEERKKHEAFHVVLERLDSFYPAEKYHQNYLLKNPSGYCHVRPQQLQAILQLQQEEKNEENH